MPTSTYPALLTDDVPRTSAFYRDTLGFTETYTSDWYVSLRNGNNELGVLAYDHASVPERFRRPAGGVLINIEVDDVDATFASLDGVTVVQPLRTEDWGQRHVIVEAPDGVLIDLIQNIPPTEEFAGGYVS